MEVQSLKLATNLETGSRSAEKKSSQIAKNNIAIAAAIAAK
ncbi:MAG: hypothetical protein ACOH2A_04060 [Sphingobacteriaceae bacterium]